MHLILKIRIMLWTSLMPTSRIKVNTLKRIQWSFWFKILIKWTKVRLDHFPFLNFIPLLEMMNCYLCLTIIHSNIMNLCLNLKNGVSLDHFQTLWQWTTVFNNWWLIWKMELLIWTSLSLIDFMQQNQVYGDIIILFRNGHVKTISSRTQWCPSNTTSHPWHWDRRSKLLILLVLSSDQLRRVWCWPLLSAPHQTRFNWTWSGVNRC